MHIYYHSKGLTDIDSIRNDARYRLKQTGEQSLIHLHPKGDGTCFDGAGNLDPFWHEWCVDETVTPVPQHARIDPETKMLTWGDQSGEVHPS